MKERPREIESKTIKESVACGTIYVTIGFDKDKEPIEVFIAGSKSSGCKGSQEAIGRLTSLCLRKDLYKEAFDQLFGIQCVACNRARGELPKESRKDYPSSCADAVARILGTYGKKLPETTTGK